VDKDELEGPRRRPGPHPDILPTTLLQTATSKVVQLQIPRCQVTSGSGTSERKVPPEGSQMSSLSLWEPVSERGTMMGSGWID
jgi:hypothetical protein